MARGTGGGVGSGRGFAYVAGLTPGTDVIWRMRCWKRSIAPMRASLLSVRAGSARSTLVTWACAEPIMWGPLTPVHRREESCAGRWRKKVAVGGAGARGRGIGVGQIRCAAIQTPRLNRSWHRCPIQSIPRIACEVTSVSTGGG